jgi:hypothetical protein
LEAGELTGKDDMEKQITSNQEVSEAIQDKIGESAILSEEGKKTFAKSLPHYGIGSFGIVKSAKTAIAKGKSLKNIRDLSVLKKLDSLLSYTKKAPSLIKNETNATGTIIKFCKANGVDTADLKKETDNW